MQLSQHVRPVSGWNQTVRSKYSYIWSAVFQAEKDPGGKTVFQQMALDIHRHRDGFNI